jgi:hypothetical protein
MEYLGVVPSKKFLVFRGTDPKVAGIISIAKKLIKVTKFWGGVPRGRPLKILFGLYFELIYNDASSSLPKKFC